MDFAVLTFSPGWDELVDDAPDYGEQSKQGEEGTPHHSFLLAIPRAML